MKAAVLVKNKVELKEFNLPKVGNNEVLVRMKACGICGSDLEKVFGKYGMKSSRIGHEPAGEIVKVGANIKDFQKGDRVFIHHHVPCYSCHFCYNEDYTMCEKYQKSNIDPCGLSEFILVPHWNVSKGGLVRLPDNINYSQAALIEPIACCLRALNKINLKKADTVVIFGAGPTGLMHMILARFFGASKILIVDVNSFRLEFAKKIDQLVEVINIVNMHEGEFKRKSLKYLGKNGSDVSIISTSNINAFIQSLSITRKGGSISLFGVPPKDTEAVIDLNLIYSRELKILPSYAASEREIHQTISLMEAKIMNFEPLITHRFPLRDSNRALMHAHQAKDSMKIIITTE
ncbi:MAG TPA: zinc-dependent dehydrogenase [Candidatus Nitrosocosmicus sp.]|nr:zinc-dependent dehydrogenase [Candidatus Nitrosocosmicus sp.]